MRKLKVFESISIDGYFADSNDDVSFAYAVAADPEFSAWVGENAGAGGALLFGRKTYEMMEAYWTSHAAMEAMPEVAKGMNAAKKYVASTTLEPGWRNCERLDGDLLDAVRKLKESKGLPLVVLGSGSVAAALGAAGLVDEYQFVVIPTALGSGRSVFSKETKLRLVGQRAFDNGNVVLNYAV